MPYRRFNSLSQLALSLLAFSAVALLLESGGLLTWATRLELGPERSLLLPAAIAIDRTLHPLRLDALRRSELSALAHLGWSSDRDPAPLPPNLPPQRPPVIMPAAPGMSAAVAAAVLPGAPPPLLAPTPHTPLLALAAAPPLLTMLAPLPIAHPAPRIVALTGDSMMAVGLAPELLRQATRYPALTLLKAFRSGTGLARPEVFDWLTEYHNLLGPAHPDIVIVALGANDGQGFVEAGTTYLFGTPAWAAMYQRRVQAFLSLLEASGATVVWIGLPSMRADDYDKRLALVNRIQYTVVSSSHHAQWLSTAGLVGDSAGRYQDFGFVHGSLLRLRQPDGIHLSDDGAALIATQLLPWLAAKPIR